MSLILPVDPKALQIFSSCYPRGDDTQATDLLKVYEGADFWQLSDYFQNFRNRCELNGLSDEEIHAVALRRSILAFSTFLAYFGMIPPFNAVTKKYSGSLKDVGIESIRKLGPEALSSSNDLELEQIATVDLSKSMGLDEQSKAMADAIRRTCPQFN